MNPSYQGIEPNEKYFGLECEVRMIILMHPEWRDDRDYFSQRDAKKIAELKQRMKMVRFNGS